MALNELESDSVPENLSLCCLSKSACLFLETSDDGNSVALLYQTVSELPLPNRDTLACLMIHLQK